LGTSGHGDEAAAFRAIQDRLGPIYREIFFDGNAPRTVVVVPSLSLGQEVLAKISGVHHYEERMRCLLLLLLLRLPRTEVIFLTSKPVSETISHTVMPDRLSYSKTARKAQNAPTFRDLRRLRRSARGIGRLSAVSFALQSGAGLHLPSRD
jgi:hypothetical protein